MKHAHYGTNRVTLLTPPGVGALAVVRIAGPVVGAFLEKHFTKVARPGRCVHGELRVEGQVLDDPVVGLSAEGSFADISLHGGDWIVRRTLELATDAGFALVTDIATDEATDAVERDMLTALQSARTELAIRVLLAQPVAWQALRDGRADPDALRRAAADVTLHNLLRLPRVAIVGAPNVGKSTLANRLFGSERSITADLPGTTRDWVGEIADIDGLAVLLVDTAGVRPTTDAIERRAIELGAAQSAVADLVVLVIDPTQSSSDIATLAERHPNAIVVLNKADQPPTVLPTLHVHCQTIATTGAGVDVLRRAIADRFGCADVDPSIARWWTDAQRDAIRQALATGQPFLGFE